jgi:hypothetical protein
MNKQDVKRLLWVASGQLQNVAMDLSLGQGQGERRHSEYERAAQAAGFVKREIVDSNHGRGYSRLEPTESGKKLDSMVQALKKLQIEIEALADSL